MEPAHMPILFAQVGEISTAAEGLSKGGAYFIAAVLAALCWALYRENRDLHAAALAREKANSEAREKLINDKLDLIKEINPLANKLADSVQVNGQIAAQLTRE